MQKMPMTEALQPQHKRVNSWEQPELVAVEQQAWKAMGKKIEG